MNNQKLGPFNLTGNASFQAISSEFQTDECGLFSFEIKSTGNAVTGLKLQQRLSEGGDYEDLMVDSDFTSSSDVQIIRANLALPLAAGTVGWAKLRVARTHRLRFVVTLAGAGSAIIQGVK